MSKTQTWFHLKSSFRLIYKGLFVLQLVIPTNAVIKIKDIENTEEINVTLEAVNM